MHRLAIYTARRGFATAPGPLSPDIPHFRVISCPHKSDSTLPHPEYVQDKTLVETQNLNVWSAEEVLKVEVTHKPAETTADKVALFGIRVLRLFFDIGSGYAFGPINERKLLRRVIFLETVAGIPGMVAASLRHLESLRRMRRDQGWIRTLLEEAENERMHLMCFTELRNPGLLFRGCALIAQGIFWNVYFTAYLISPATCHRFVGYLEEEAVVTYTKALEAYDQGMLGSWPTLEVPKLAKRYWQLADNATLRDVLLAVRADESNHRDVNHLLATTKSDAKNPVSQ